MSLRTLILATLMIAMSSTLAVASPTPVPGGANQVKALSGHLGDTIFNGVLRIKITELREATAADSPDKMFPQPNQKVMIMSVLLRNGSHSEFIDLVRYTLADADNVTLTIPDSNIANANLHIQQGASARQSATFLVDKTFAPTKLLVQCATCGAKSGFKSIRFTIAH